MPGNTSETCPDCGETVDDLVEHYLGCPKRKQSIFDASDASDASDADRRKSRRAKTSDRRTPVGRKSNVPKTDD